MPRLTPEEQLDRLEARAAILRSQLAKAKQRRDNRVKVLLGVVMLNHLQQRPAKIEPMRELVREHLDTKSKSVKVQERSKRDREFLLEELDRMFPPAPEANEVSQEAKKSDVMAKGRDDAAEGEPPRSQADSHRQNAPSGDIAEAEEV